MLLQKKEGNWVEDKEDKVFSSQWKMLMFVLCFNIEIWLSEKGKISYLKV